MSDAEPGELLFFTAHIGGVPIEVMVDCGSSFSVINVEEWKRRQEHCLFPLTTRRRRLRVANCGVMESPGVAHFGFQVTDTAGNTHEIKSPMVVGPIPVPCILGQDFMRCHGGDVLNSVTELRLSGLGYNLPLHERRRDHSVYQIALAQDVVVPARQSLNAPGRLPPVSAKQVFVEADYSTDLGVAVGRGICLTSSPIIPVNLANPSTSPVTLRQGTFIAVAMPMEDDAPIVALVDETKMKPPDKTAADGAIPEVVPDPPPEDLPEHLRDLFLRSTEKLTPQQKSSVRSLLLRRQRAFAKDKTDYGRTDLVEHTIDTGDTRPIKHRARRYPPSKRDKGQAEVERMLKAGVIEPSKSPWSSPVVLAEKPRSPDEIRFAVDYRDLNKFTILDSYPLPRMDDCLDALSGAKYFSSIDLMSGFHQIKVAERDKEKTAFSTPSGGLYQFNVMPFGSFKGVSSLYLGPKQAVTDLRKSRRWRTWVSTRFPRFLW